MSLSPKGMPCSGPRDRPAASSASACRACRRARSNVGVMNARVWVSYCSMRWISASIRSTGDSFRAAIRRESSAIERSCRSAVMAEVSRRRSCPRNRAPSRARVPYTVSAPPPLISVDDTYSKPSPWRAIAASTVLNAPIGSLYAFSVFLQPLEALLGLTRADLAFVFALAAAGFGVGMNVAPYVFGVAPTSVLVLACAIASSLGIALAATADGLAQLAVGYGVLFGAGGGAAYILAQQTVNLAITRRHGLVNGYVVALYPAGAMLAAPVFGWSIRQFGVRLTLGGLATVLAITGSAS